MVYGDTYFQAISNIDIVISGWIETAKLIGREIPVPKIRLIYG